VRRHCVYAGIPHSSSLKLSRSRVQPSGSGERSKFTEETLSNVQLKSATPKVFSAGSLQAGGELDNLTRLITEGPGIRSIIVTLRLQLWAICTASDQQRR